MMSIRDQEGSGEGSLSAWDGPRGLGGTTRAESGEAAFKTLKSDLQLRPIRHHVELRIEAHILVCFLAYCLPVTLRQRLEARAPGLTPRAVLEALSDILMLDVHLPLADGRELVLPRYKSLHG